MSAKLRQFTCSCSYTAPGTSDLPSILCIHLISGTHSLTPADMCCDMQQTVKGIAVFVSCCCIQRPDFLGLVCSHVGILMNNPKHSGVNQQCLIWIQICLDLSTECRSWTREGFIYLFIYYLRGGGCAMFSKLESGIFGPTLASCLQPARNGKRLTGFPQTQQW